MTVPSPTPAAIATRNGDKLWAGPIAGIVIGCLLFLLLLILLLILLVVLYRRRRKQAPPTVAYSNETYDRLSSVVASLSSLSDSITAYDHYDVVDDGKNDKKDLPLPEVFADDPPLYFADDSAAGATGYDCFAKVPEKKALPFPEVCAGDMPVFKIDGGLANPKDQQDLLGQLAHPPTGDLPAYEDIAINGESRSTHI